MNSGFRWKFLYTKKASEDLKSLPKSARERIAEKMRFFSESEDIFKFTKALEDKKVGNFRFRIGDYRIIFEKAKNKKEIYVLKIRERDEVYK